jgi:general secretion pathway protein G
MRKKAFTLVEILVVVIVIGILATLGFPAYQNAVEASKEKVCSANLEVLQAAVEIYTMEHNTVPGSLSALKPEHIEKAFAKVMQGKDAWKKRLAYFIVEAPQWGLAYAQGFSSPRLRCPKNPDTSSTAISYGLNAALANMSSSAYNALPDSTLVVADSDTLLFSLPNPNIQQMLQARGHKKYQMASFQVYLKGVIKGRGRVRIKNGYMEDDNGNYLSSG